MYCPRCGLGQPSDHRFSLSCGARLPTELLPHRGPKVTRWFRSILVHPEDRPGSMLRVSRYLDEFDIETEDGSGRVPAHHVRLSFWLADRAVCALSIPDDEAEALSVFLAAAVADGHSREPIPITPAGRGRHPPGRSWEHPWRPLPPGRPLIRE